MGQQKVAQQQASTARDGNSRRLPERARMAELQQREEEQQSSSAWWWASKTFEFEMVCGELGAVLTVIREAETGVSSSAC